jgi:hypothetical protein
MSFLRIIPLHRSGICYLCSPTMDTWLHSTLASFAVTNSLTNACLFINMVGKKWKWDPKFNLSMLNTCTTRSPHKTIFSMMMPPNTSQMVVNNPHYSHKQFLVGWPQQHNSLFRNPLPFIPHLFHKSQPTSASMSLADLWQITLFLSLWSSILLVYFLCPDCYVLWWLVFSSFYLSCTSCGYIPILAFF